MGWTIVGVICIILQVMSWIGNGGIPSVSGVPIIYSIVFFLSANALLILGIIFLIIGQRWKAKKKAAKKAESSPSEKQNEIH